MIKVLEWVAGFILVIILARYQFIQEWYVYPSHRLQNMERQSEITNHAKKMPPSFKRSVILHRKLLEVILAIILLFVFFQFNDHVVDGHFIK